jgi:hypothetical protein
MLRVLQMVLVLCSLLALAFVAAKANSAPLPEPEAQSPTIGPATPSECAASTCRHPHHRRVIPGPQAGTHLQAQPYAYGYFGAHAPTTAAFHTSNRGNWYQWTFSRAD